MSETETHEFLPTRHSLLTRLKRWDDQEAWREFFDTYWKLIFSVALKAGFPKAEAEDIVQETVLVVAKKMRRFHYDPALGSFKGWLLLNVRSRIADHLRRCRCRIQMVPPSREDTADTRLIERVPDASALDLEALWEQEWRQHLFEAALERVKQKVAVKQFQIFDFCVLQQAPPAKVTALLGIGLGQVYLAKHRVARLIQKEVRRLEQKML